jgi:hypothetical protein
MGNAIKISLINAHPISIFHILEISDIPSTLSVRPDIYRVNLELRLVRPTIYTLETEPDPGLVQEQIASVRTYTTGSKKSQPDSARGVRLTRTNPNPASCGGFSVLEMCKL